ncbi:endonuclease domain-containing protein [Nonomuraea fuscirosea]|uniref:endonuclease domain-containing protein n=1 Tax=Nonomuraea fuscirosea TaxID=1291556 RepID=UPI0033EC8E7C
MRVWSDLPVGRVVRLDVDADAVALSLDPLPPGAPAILTYRPGLAELLDDARTVAGLVASVLRELDAAALALFPAWLPGAAGIDGPGGAGLRAVRSLALRRASSGEHYGPFLAELAERALAGGPSGFPPEVRAAGLARVLAGSYGRSAAAVLVHVPDGLGAGAQEVFVAGCEWLAQRAKAGVWLTGAPLDAVDRVPAVRPRLTTGPAGTGAPAARSRPSGAPAAGPGAPGEARTSGAQAGGAQGGGGRLGYPAIAGRPHPGSAAELALEAALARCAWASGRAWNQTYLPHPLAAPIRLDLLWERERCVVEIDGPDHRGAAKFAADRERDVLLQIDGYAVLRFLDVQVLTDIETVLRRIAQFLRGRRGTEG